MSHTRLSIYSSVLNHPTAPLEVRHFFRTAGLSAALNVMRAAVQGEKQLFSMPNNSAIMVSFAACFALRLSTQIASGTSNTNTNALAPSVRTLIEETAEVMDKIGNITRHRNGMCGLYAKYLRILVRKSAAETGALSRHGLGTPRPVFTESSSRHTAPFGNTALRNASVTSLSASAGGFAVPRTPSSAMAAGGYEASTSTPGWSGPGTTAADLFPFSSMSGDQIVEALTRAGGEFDVANTGAGGGGFGGAGGGLLGGAGGAAPGGGFGWDDSGGFDFLPTWSNWPDLGF